MDLVNIIKKYLGRPLIMSNLAVRIQNRVMFTIYPILVTVLVILRFFFFIGRATIFNRKNLIFLYFNKAPYKGSPIQLPFSNCYKNPAEYILKIIFYLEVQSFIQMSAGPIRSIQPSY